ncbi:hypothetical protein GCM10010446_11330 [Streptomyces enissocaesilis]|uniref:Uncharacterized protein n=1 Tax=Streptomyces enissocaesilis TaxID=332589 RepID=A0ABP6JC81_9ACTN
MKGGLPISGAQNIGPLAATGYHPHGIEEAFADYDLRPWADCGNPAPGAPGAPHVPWCC